MKQVAEAVAPIEYKRPNDAAAALKNKIAANDIVTPRAMPRKPQESRTGRKDDLRAMFYEEICPSLSRFREAENLP